MKKPLHTLRSPAIYLCILTTVFLVVMAAENAGFTRKNASLSQVFHFSTQDQLIDCSSDWTFKDGTPAQLDQLAVQTHGRNEIVSQLLWNVFGYDVHDCGPLIMSILIASFVHFIYVSVKDLPSEPKFLERYIWMIIGLATFMGTGFVDYFRHNIMGIRFQDTAAFSRTGYIFLMILLTIQYVNEIKWRLTTSMKAEIYRHQAYTDPLTGLGNRTSWRTSHDSLVAQMKEETLKKTENNPPPKKEEVNNNKTKNNSEIEDKRYISNNRKKKNKKKNKKFFHGDNQNKNNQNTNKNPDDNNIFCFENVEIIGNKKIFELLVVFNVIMILIILCLIGSIYSIKSNIEYERVLEDEFMNKLSYLNVINDYGDDDYIPKMGGGDWDPNDILFENEQQKAYFKEEIISRENKKIKDVEFILRHKSSRDGKNFETFFNNCKGVEENLLLIRNEKGQKFALLSKNLIDVLRGNKVKESQVKKNFIMYNFNKHDIFEYNFSRNFEEIYSSFIKNIFNFFSEKGEYEDSRLKFIGRIVEIEIYELKFIK